MNETIEPAILIVEEEQMTRMLLVRALSGPYHVTAAPNAVQGISVIKERSERISLIITNQGEPHVGTGRLVLAAAKRYRPGVPVIVITGGRVTKDMFLEKMRPDKLITKPFELEALLAAIEQILSAESALASQLA